MEKKERPDKKNSFSAVTDYGYLKTLLIVFVGSIHTWPSEEKLLRLVP